MSFTCQALTCNVMYVQLMDKLTLFFSEDRKSIENNVRVCLSTNKCFVKVRFYIFNKLCCKNYFKKQVSVQLTEIFFFRFQLCHIHSIVRETTGSWTWLRSQRRWCAGTSEASCSSSPIWPARCKRRTWANNRSIAQLPAPMNLKLADLFVSSVRWSSEVLSPLIPS